MPATPMCPETHAGSLYRGHPAGGHLPAARRRPAGHDERGRLGQFASGGNRARCRRRHASPAATGRFPRRRRGSVPRRPGPGGRSSRKTAGRTEGAEKEGILPTSFGVCLNSSGGRYGFHSIPHRRSGCLSFPVVVRPDRAISLRHATEDRRASGPDPALTRSVAPIS